MNTNIVNFVIAFSFSISSVFLGELNSNNYFSLNSEKINYVSPGLSAFDFLTESRLENSRTELIENKTLFELDHSNSITKAVWVEGEIRPIIELPVFEVHTNQEANKENKSHFLSKEYVDYSKDPNLLKAKIVNGEIIPIIELNPIEICGNC